MLLLASNVIEVCAEYKISLYNVMFEMCNL